MSQSKATKAGEPVRTKAKEKLRAVYDLQAELCKSLAHPVRLEIIDLLEQGELSNATLVEALGLPKANVSAHIAVLKDAKIINARKEGVHIYVSIQFKEVVEACHLVRNALGAIIESKHAESRHARNLLARRK